MPAVVSSLQQQQCWERGRCEHCCKSAALPIGLRHDFPRRGKGKLFLRHGHPAFSDQEKQARQRSDMEKAERNDMYQMGTGCALYSAVRAHSL